MKKLLWCCNRHEKQKHVAVLAKKLSMTLELYYKIIVLEAAAMLHDTDAELLTPILKLKKGASTAVLPPLLFVHWKKSQACKKMQT